MDNIWLIMVNNGCESTVSGNSMSAVSHAVHQPLHWLKTPNALAQWKRNVVHELLGDGWRIGGCWRPPRLIEQYHAAWCFGIPSGNLT